MANLELPEEIHLMLLQALPFGLCFADVHGRVRFWNQAAGQITGYSAPEALSAPGKHAVLHFFEEKDGSEYVENGSRRALVRHHGGYPVPVEHLRLPLRDADESVLGFVDIFSIAEDLGADLSAGSGDAAAILFVEIDRFEEIIHRYGSEAGEKVVAVIDHSLAACLRPSDVTFHLSDSCVRVILVSGVERDVAALVTRIQTLLRGTSVRWWGSEIRFTASLGGAMRRPGENDASLNDRAQASLNEALLQGGGAIAWSKA